MRFALIALLLLGAGCSSAPPQQDAPPAQTTPEVETTEVAPEPETTPESMGPDLAELPPADSADGVAARIAKAHGYDAFESAGQIVFTFVLVNAGTEVFSAKHVWDRSGQRARVEWKDRDSEIVAVVELTEPTSGWVTVDGERADDTATHKYLKTAYGRWVNDTYWAFMPLKVVDEGVIRKLVENRSYLDRPHRVLKLTFGEVGLTPGDTYWVYADAETYRVNRWDMLLEQMPKDDSPAEVSWADHRDVGGITVAHDHAIVSTPRKIQIRDVVISEGVDESLFAAPD